jgi:hypothetical protein
MVRLRFASALAINQRTGQIDVAEAQTAWRQFELKLVAV